MSSGNHANPQNKPPRWQHFNHEADIGIRGFGSTPAEAFAAAATALTAVVTDVAAVAPKVRMTIEIEESDPEWQFFRFINAIVYEMATRNMLFHDFRVRLDRDRLFAEIFGEAVDLKRHQPAVEVKGATLTELSVRPCAEGWCAQCIVDV